MSCLQAIKLLSNAGATINELNMFRRVVSQTKGGRLAEAAYPAKVKIIHKCLYVEMLIACI